MKIKLRNVEEFNKKIIYAGFSKRGFAGEAQIAESTVVQICNGDRNPSPKTAKRICEVLECEWSELFEIVKSPQRVGK